MTPSKPCTYHWNFFGNGAYISSSTDMKMTPILFYSEDTSNPGNPTSVWEGYYWQLTTPDAGQHEMAYTSPGVYRATDGSGYVFNESNYTLTDNVGTHWVYAGTPPTQYIKYPVLNRLLYVEDANGNRITLNYDAQNNFTGWTDTLEAIS